jgi:hypothetical protein
MVVVMAVLRLVLLLCAAAVVAAGVPAPARADRGSDGDREARVSTRCAGGATSQLRLRSHDGSIRLEFELKRRRARESWRVVIVHERRVSWRGTLRTGDSGSFRVRRSLDDYEGVDRVTVRAAGPRGLTCETSARLLG